MQIDSAVGIPSPLQEADLVGRRLPLGQLQNIIISNVGDRHGNFRGGKFRLLFAKNDLVNDILDLLAAG
jgi:hypothetical protein